MSNPNRKESRFFTASGVLKGQVGDQGAARNMEQSSPPSKMTSPQSQRVTSPLRSPSGASSVTSPSSGNTSQPTATPGPNRRPQHSRVTSADSVVTAIHDSPGSPDGGVSLGSKRGDVQILHPASPQYSARHQRADSDTTTLLGTGGSGNVGSSPSQVPSPVGSMITEFSRTRGTIKPGYENSYGLHVPPVIPGRDEPVRSQFGKRNVSFQQDQGSRDHTPAGADFLAPGSAGERAMTRIVERVSAQNLHAMSQRSADTQDSINNMILSEINRKQESIDALTTLASHQQQRMNTLDDRMLQVEKFSAGSSIELQRRLDHVEQQMNALRVSSVQTTPVLGQFPQFAAPAPHTHPGHVQQPVQAQHPAYQPRSQRSTQVPPRGQGNFRVNMMQLPSLDTASEAPAGLASGLETPKAKIIKTPHSGAFIDQDKLSSIAPNPADDVFGPGLCAPGPLPKAQFGQKTYRELMPQLFSRSEMLIRQYFRSTYYANSKDPRAVHVSRIAAAHLESRQAAEKYLVDPSARVYLFVGMAHRWLVDNIYKAVLLDGYTDLDTGRRLQELFAKEYYYQENGPVWAMEYGTRGQIAAERSSICQGIAGQTGFWKFVQSLSSSLTDDFMNQFSSLIPVHHLPRARDEFHKVIFDVTKVAVRMRQEPFFFEIIFYRFGVRWDFKGMIQRNEEFQGLSVEDNPPQHVVRTTMSPCVIQKGFEGNKLQMETILKGEVHLTERKGNLR